MISIWLCKCMWRLPKLQLVKWGLGSTSNGFVSKLIEYHGKVAHAAQAPHEGINALNAALMGVMGG